MLSANVVYPGREDPTEWSPSTVFKFAGGVEARHRRLHDRVDAGRRVPGEPRPVRGPAGHPGGQRRGGEALPTRPTRSSPSGTRARTPGTVTDPTGPLIDIADGVAERRRGDRRPQRPPGRRAAPERRARDREPRQGHPLHADAPRDRPGQGRRRLQDGRLPQAVEHRPDAGPGDPGEDRRAERSAGADPQRADRRRRRRRSRAPTSAATPPGGLCESLVGNVVTDAMRDDVQRDRRAVRDHELGRPPRPT